MVHVFLFMFLHVVADTVGRRRRHSSGGATSMLSSGYDGESYRFYYDIVNEPTSDFGAYISFAVKKWASVAPVCYSERFTNQFDPSFRVVFEKGK